MAYTINLTNGTEIIAGGLSDGSIDTSATSLTLIGKNYAGYGEYLNENFVHLLENFAASTGPANPLKGQLWWDTTNNILKVYSGSSWKISTGATSSPFSSPPGDLSALGGDLWFDSTNQQLKVYSGVSWITVGPVATPTTGDTGAFPALMTDTLGINHVVTQIKIFGVPYVIISKDTFNSPLTGFGTIKAGINFSTASSPALQLNTQDISANPNTLVQRDITGAIAATGITGTTVTAGTINASTFNGSFTGNITGNVFATTVLSSVIQSAGITATSGFSGTMLTASQPNITSLGTLTGLNVGGNVNINAASAILNGSPIATIGGSATFSSINNTPIGNIFPSTGSFTTINGGTWQGNIISPTYGGTGVNNGTNTLTVTGNFTINQNVAANSSPTLRGTNFNSIPNGALINSGLTIGGTFVPLGGTYSAPVTVSSIAGTTNQITASSATGAVTLSLPQNIATGSSVQFGSIGVGTAASGTAGEIRATNNIVAYFSDDRLKTRLGKVENALDKICSLEGFYYEANKTAQELGYVPKREIGLSAQSTQAVFPEITAPAPINAEYLTIMYEKFAPIFVEAIKELRAEIEEIKRRI